MKSADSFFKVNILLIIISILSITACGLPVYEVLNPPLKISYTGTNLIGFTTPSDSLIDGYIIYYKIYYSGDNLLRDEEKLFDPSYYENDNLNELPSGEVLPLEKGFYKLGMLNKTSSANPQIPLTGGNHTVQLDFINSQNQSQGFDPRLLINSADVSDSIGYPARGVKYSDIGLSGEYQNDNTFKRFVKNYEYINGSNQIDKDIQEMISRSSVDQATVEISFVAISYGISDTTLQPLMSVPVHLGYIIQTNMADNSLNAPDKS